MLKPNPPGRWVSRVIGAAGVALALGGGWLFQSDFAARDAARVAALPRVDPAGLQQQTPGTALLLEGELVAREPVGPSGLVAFHRERFSGFESSDSDQRKERWSRVETVRPVIAITSGGAEADVANRDYRLDSWLHSVRTDDAPRRHGMFEGPERFLGFKAGDRVTADGRVVEGTAGQPAARRLEIMVLFGGGAEAYVKSTRAGILVPKIVGGVFAAFGVLMMAVGGLWPGLRGKTATSR